MLKNDRKQVAFHEAAHAVVLAICQMEFTSVGIHQTSKEAKRHHRMGWLVHEYETFNIKQAAVMCIGSYASMAAERLAGQELGYFELSITHCHDD